MRSPHQKWVRLISPGACDKLPHLFSVSTEWTNSPSYRHDDDTLREPNDLCTFKYTLEGYGFITYGGTTYKVDPGKAFIISERVPGTSFYYPPKETARWSFVDCTFLYLEDAVEHLNSRHGPVYELGEKSLLVQKLLALMPAKKLGDTMISGAESFAICADIIQEMYRIVELKDNGEGGSVAIKARNLIYQQRMQDFSLSELAASLGVCSGHLCREFKNELNDTPKHYYNTLRMRSIMEHLINTSSPLKELVTKFGFNSAPSFNAFFKKHSGQSPGQFRRGGHHATF